MELPIIYSKRQGAPLAACTWRLLGVLYTGYRQPRALSALRPRQRPLGYLHTPEARAAGRAGFHE